MTSLFTKKEISDNQSLLTTRWNELKKEHDSKTAHAIAAEEIASLHGMSRTEFLRTMMLSQRHHYSNKKPTSKKKPAVVSFSDNGIASKYAAWCEKSKQVASDREIAYWAGCTPQAIGYARSKLASLGYQFEKNENGFSIKPSAKNKYFQELKSLKAQIAQLEKKLEE